LRSSMKPNLDEMKMEIPSEIESRGLGVFPGFSRIMEQIPIVFWDSEKSPDYRAFLDTATKIGAKVIVFHDREFVSELVEDALERLEEATGLAREEQRAYDRRLREMRVYAGFTCALELSFDQNGIAYMFELRTDWFDELNQILEDLEASIPDDDGGDDDGDPIGGFFSKN
jgi:hypothetical protein